MKLLSENELVWSPVVANSKMNRERNASGINSYEKEFKFKPESFLRDHIDSKDQVKWLDICCGQGKALIQAALHLSEKGLQDKATLRGIDLIDSFLPIPPAINCIEFEIRSVVNWSPGEKYDLITCVHGLHYIGDKLKVLKTIFGSLNPGGIFMANLDLANIKIADCNTEKYLKDLFRVNSIAYKARSKTIACKGPVKIDFGVCYEGATDKAGPNYTGQEAVNSFYTFI
jgi:2-polyprenyl-3-methyl-5-hydroxy-6-metoxy-1,4-benzoquinol methylase